MYEKELGKIIQAQVISTLHDALPIYSTRYLRTDNE